MTVARVATVLLVLWAAAFWLAEGLAQGIADASLLTCGVLAFTRRLPRLGSARVPVLLALALAGWQATSPLVARVAGSPFWPAAGGWAHCLDTAALAAAAVLGASVIRWESVEETFVGFGIASFGLSLVQHFVRWSVPLPSMLRLPVDRVHETFAGEQRYAAGGFFFHRLRLAHGAIAALGPALAAALSAASPRRRLLGGGLVMVCLVCTVLAYARAALLTGALLVAIAALGLARGWGRRLALYAVGVLVLAALLSPGWRLRFGTAAENFVGGERSEARAAGWDLVRQHPVLGVGFGNYRHAALARAPVTHVPDQLSRDAHAIPLTVWAETGLPGLGLYVALHASLALALWRRARAGAWPAVGALLSWVGWHVLGVAHHLPFHPSVALGFAFVWGVGLVHGGHVGRECADVPSTAPTLADG